MSNKNKNAQDLGSNLESANEPLRMPSNKVAVNYADIEWLENENPMDFVSPDNSSSKFDEKREIVIQQGLPVVAALTLDGVTINPLLILLGKWWEVKPARASIKKLIDEEAIAKGIDPAVYLQVNLAKEVDKISEMQSAIDRIKYAKTYFKPRKPLTDKIITKPIAIDGLVYIVPVAEFEACKAKYAELVHETEEDKENAKAEMKLEVIAFSKLQNLEVEEL